jgi:predicted signal transduction protein with EAL and GGDEF domain
MDKPFIIDGHAIDVSVSIGIAVASGDGNSPDSVLKNADLALYRAKLDGRGTWRFFEPEMDAQMQFQRRLEHDLRRALAAGQFEVHYQPVLDLCTGRVTGLEALLRWRHPERGLVPPAAFIPLAEEVGLIGPIGEWALRRACGHAAGWPEAVKIAVNVSAVQFRARAALVDAVRAALQETGLPAARLVIEVTETAILQDTEDTLATLHALQDLGVEIALDDFGTGYSSLSHLHTLPVDALKIDRSFVTSLMVPGRPAIVESILALARTLHTSVVAEGVETDWQARELERLGCLHAQGYFFSVPLPGSSVPDLLVARRPLGSAPATAGAHPHPLDSTAAESLPLSRTVVAAR